jgi:hypothetical protein
MVLVLVVVEVEEDEARGSLSNGTEAHDTRGSGTAANLQL